MKTSTQFGIAVVIVVILGGAYYLFNQSTSNTQTNQLQPATDQTTAPVNPQPAVQTPPAPAPPSQTTHPAPSYVSVLIANFAFSTNTIMVKKGDTVIWKNSDPASHTVTSDGGAFSSANISQGGSFSHTFNSTGTFTYHCSIHPNMHGTIIVTQ